MSVSARRWDGSKRSACVATYAGPAARTMSASSSTAARGLRRGARSALRVRYGCAPGALRVRHQLVDGINGGVAEFARHVRVDRGRARTRMPEVFLDEHEGH